MPCLRAQANEIVRAVLVPEYNRRWAVAAADESDAHRSLGRAYCLPAILSIQEKRVVRNDYTIRLHNRWYRLEKPALPGLRGGRVIVEQRRDGTTAIRFGERYLKYHEIVAEARGKAEQVGEGGAAACAPGSLRSPSAPAPAPLPASPSSYRPAADHPWRRSFL